MQNTAGILILQRDRWSSAMVMLNELYWLPIKKRISFKVLFVLYKAMYGLTPDYITVLATPYVLQRHLRSANDNLIVVPKTQLHYGNTRGKQKETIMSTYKSVMRPALEYASSIWSPFASSANINKL